MLVALKAIEMNETTDAVQIEKSPWWFRPWWIIGGMVVVLVIAAPFAYRGYRIAGLPDIGHPFDIEEFGTVEISDAENAFVEYRLAARAIIALPDADDDDLKKATKPETDWADVKPNIRKWLEDNRATLKIWRQGTEKPKAVNHQPKDMNYDTLLPVIQEFRNFARLSGLESKRLIAEGDVESAWNWYRAAFRASRHSGRHGCMIERLVGVSVHNMVTMDLVHWSSNEDVDAEILQKAIKDLNADYLLTTQNSDVYMTEFLAGRNELKSPDMILEFVDVPLGKFGVYLFNEMELNHRLNQQIFANLMSQVDKRRNDRAILYSGTPDLFEVGPEDTGFSGQLEPQELEVFIERSFYGSYLGTSYTQMDNAISREQTKQACLITLLASQWYQRDHGTFPEKLVDLVPKYLPKLQQDPFGQKGDRIRYSIDEEKAVFWSVGNNETDDGGNIAEPDFLDYGLEIKLKTKD